MRDGTGTRATIQATALRLFVEQGITETTIRHIADAAHIAEGTLYRHYASKEDLAWDLFSSNFTAFAKRLDEIQRTARTCRAKLEAMIRHACAFFDEDRVLFTYLLLSQHGQLKKVTPDMPHPVTVLRTVIAEGMRRGEIPRADPDVATAMVMGLVLQVALDRVYGRVGTPLSRLADTLTAAAWRVLSPTPPGRRRT